MKLTQRDAETLAAALCETDPEPNEAMRRAAVVHDRYRREVMDRIAEHRIAGTVTNEDVTASIKACKGAPATIQPGAVAQMAEALEATKMYLDEWPGTLQVVEDALTAYYGEEL